MGNTIQDVFNVDQQLGMVGAPARPGQSFGATPFIIGATVPQPGEAFIITLGLAERPANQIEAALAVGVVSFSQGDVNSPITKTVNHNTGVVFVEDDEAPCMRDGYIFVQAGGVVSDGDTVIFVAATGKWIVGTTTKSAFIAQGDAVDGDILVIQMTRIA